MNIDDLVDFANKQHSEIGKFQIRLILPPEKMRFSPFCVPTLTWQSVKYGEAEANQVPADKRGVYAFALCEPSSVLPPHGYILYIGIAGRKSDRSLRARYGDYLNAKKVMKRARIAHMIGTWHSVLRFYFAPVDNNFPEAELEKLELELNTALLPPFSEGDLEAETKAMRRAFK